MWESTEPPIVEKIASQDGAYQLTTPPPGPGEKTTDELFATGNANPVVSVEKEFETRNQTQEIDLMSIDRELDAARSQSSFPPLIQDSPLKKKKDKEDPIKQTEEKKTATKVKNMTEQTITKAELSDYPEEPKPSRIEGLLVYISFAGIILLSLLFLNYRRVLLIPGLKRFRAPQIEQSVLKPQVKSEINSASNPKFGFPVIDEDGNMHFEQNTRQKEENKPKK